MNGFPRFGTKRFGEYLESLRPMKPCPFCGDGNASVEFSVKSEPTETIYSAYVECWECGATSAETNLLCPGTAAKWASEAWNRRYEENQVP